MNLLSFFAFAVYAAETILSPLPDELPLQYVEPSLPTISFGALTQTVAAPVVLGASTQEQKGSGLKEDQGLTPRRARKNAFIIAAIGDSMTDTLGPDLGGLAGKLNRAYPGVSFSLLNYGVGATNIDHGITRITNDYDYMGRHVPSLVSQRPDVIVIESFGYNPYPFDEGAMDKYWLALSRAVDTIRSNLPEARIVIAATIAPNWDAFGDGAPGVSFSDQAKREHVTVVKRYLENTVRFAQSQGLPLADAYHPSLQADGNGKLQYINGGDHIHYSDSGRDLFGRTVTQSIVANKLLE